MFFKYSTSLIPPNKSRGRLVKEDLPEEPTKSKNKSSKQKQVRQVESSDSAGEPTKVTQATKEPAASKKATASSKNKITKRKLVLIDETIMSKEELEHRPLSNKKRVPKGIKMLSNAVLLEIDALKAQKVSRRESKLQHQDSGSSEGTGSKPGVPDKLIGKFAISDE
nr:hypothetical protein [Tanacetum cinerariifolium]